ncbi:MAG TPA: glycine C-acetyltransferase [Candidatus Obscuribacter sp.]|nr:glycine C-acetyltransferase [Candidatus Obscuribacter sp.]HMY01877.1 glycine C-acetyltransferase [Candidatus Obscuribacter sp.]HMY51960.1 glycine C-acetyltransferase [Candidatus Obscuribacter sp.]HNB14123.1 glycine C-acetyltransferase [Candidatus Obscuribacter sp.]HND05027.1 glycine C-acetyltransferase [Candidatus Obscuribacter sp.]
MSQSKVKAKKMGVKSLYQNLDSELNKSREAKTYKYEVPVEGLQGGVVQAAGRSQVMLASNNYLGLANHPRIVEAARKGLEKYGYGLASVRFICGTQNIHLELEERIARFLGVESAILHSSCFAANEAFFTALVSADLGETDYRDVIYSDQLNHASIIDGIRLSRIAVKTTDLRAYKHNDVEQLKAWLSEDQAKDYRLSVIVTDGVFSMEGEYANLADFVDIAKRNDALLFVDESHSTGVLGATGRGTPEHCGVHGKIDVISGTLGKALGGAAGGFIAGKKVLVDYLRQKSRPYTFSNSLPPAIVCAAIEAINMLEEDNSLVEKLHQNTDYFRKEVQRLGFTILPGVHPIVPVMVGEASIAQDMSNLLLDEGVYVRGLWYPVVPKGEARLRVQISAAHEVEDLDRALSAFQKVGKKLGVV